MQFTRHAITVAALAALTVGTSAQAQISNDTIKIGVLTDMAGPYSGMGGAGSVVAAKMAIDDFIAAEKPTFKIEMVSAKQQNKGDIAANKARK